MLKTLSLLQSFCHITAEIGLSQRSGVQFPQHSPDTAPTFTPPVIHPISRHAQPSYEMTSSSTTRLDEAMVAEVETLWDEELLGQGLELNDSLQSVLAKHDKIASGSPLPPQWLLCLESLIFGEEEDDFAQLARSNGEGVTSVNTNHNAGPPEVPSTPTSKEFDFVDLLSDALVPISGYSGNPTPAFNSYIAPWAQSQPQPGLPSQPQLPTQPEPEPQPLPQTSFSTSISVVVWLPPPPWAATPGYFSNPNPASRSSYTYSTPTPIASSMPLQETKSLQHVDSFPAKESYVSINGDTQFNSSPRSPSPAGQKLFIPSYRLFEDLNVFAGAYGRYKVTNNPPSGLLGNRSQSMVGGRKR
ncbi:Reticulon-like protein B3 [Olea europaea subsp. europaea]|uniref:Reticulon-like protein B3 n=1 Tax=Olea europaea subsp. europaea TaxID=158383 RepID=A0A8S0VFM1_OLEEU|nr:Reticulon-like protein B3 [Olea europaea subsp. europaea]